ncbi:cytochrome oxidase assembly protein 1 [Cytospora paraplurivora]|uniref:Cytochrome oxidase assembly protein 1 n=1 Tax=Cytospora paraplurivora TaxID=2898453 RepID=A0AAN9YLB4_9PEZI
MASSTAEQHTQPAKKPPPDDGPLPFLPAVRPRRLTEAASSSPSRHDASLRHYGLFGRLPLELRQPILTDALGGRTLHMHLQFNHPLVRRRLEVPPSRWKAFVLMTTRKGRAQLQQHREREKKRSWKDEPRHCGLLSQLVCDEERPKRWEWFGCVCHRGEKFTKEQYRVYRGGLAYVVPPLYGIRVAIETDSCCYSGLWCHCESWTPQRQATECFVGAMGWLLACRQAYADAIDILYGTNTFHLSSTILNRYSNYMHSQVLVQEFPRLILPQRLASIQSLELVWAKGPANTPFVNDYIDGEDLCWLCDALPKLFPQLKKLYLSLPFEVRRFGFAGRDDEALNDPVIDIERTLLGPVEAMLDRFPHESQIGDGLSIGIEQSFWNLLLRKHDALRMPGLRAETDLYIHFGRFWKRLPRQQNGGDGDAGYWLYSGQQGELGGVSQESYSGSILPLLRSSTPARVLIQRRAYIAAPKPGDGPLLSRRPDRELPDVETERFRWSRTLPTFFAVVALASLAIFNYQKSSSPVVSSTLYALRTNERARELLGDEIYFKAQIPWIGGTMNQLQGNIDIRFTVKGTKDTGVMRFASFRPTPKGVFETVEWSLETSDGRKIDLLEDGDPWKLIEAVDEDDDSATRGFRK